MATSTTHKRAKLLTSDEDLEEHLFQADSQWWALPEPVLARILWSLPMPDILNAGATCKRWHRISEDELLWKRKLQDHYSIAAHIKLKPGAASWQAEYIRLNDEVPSVQAQCLRAHSNQVLHVSFSHNGRMFATCSKDGYVIIWNADHPCTEKYSHNMKFFSWKYTQYSQFNQSDSLLLVSGVYFSSPRSTAGEIAVFTVDQDHESHLRCRVVNRPCDIFGTWFSDQYLISGDLHWLAHLVSTSVLWLNKANQEIDSEHVPIMNQLFKFYNRNASTIRGIMVARCPWLKEENDPLPLKGTQVGNIEFDDAKPSTSANAELRRQASLASDTVREFPNTNGKDVTIQYEDETLRHHPFTIEDAADTTDDDDDMEEYDEMENSIPKYLIFSTGSKTYTPHQIGFKRIRNVNFPKKLDPGPSLKERIAARKAAELQPREEVDWWNYESVADRFHKVDKIIDLHGHIVGMALSPDHRYLFVNTRPWPKNYEISNALEPPPTAQESDIHVIDMMSLRTIGNMLRCHKSYTPSTECFFVFLDACDHYVASGAEDFHAYLWDRYYGNCVIKFRHADVVNSVAFNPANNGMLVTTSDDYTIKVWRTRKECRELEIEAPLPNESNELKDTHIYTECPF